MEADHYMYAFLIRFAGKKTADILSIIIYVLMMVSIFLLIRDGNSYFAYIRL